MHYKTITAIWDCLRARKKAYAQFSTQAHAGIIGLAELITSIGGIMKQTEIYWLMFSRYSLDNNMFPFHVGEQQREMEANISDLFCNSRGANKWQTVYVGTHTECHLQMLAHLIVLRERYGVEFNQALVD